jgi:RNA polymerase sigma factor (sigma-70 family)
MSDPAAEGGVGGRTDAELLCSVAEGDHVSFEELYARHRDACRQRVRRTMGVQDWVDDVVQNVFLDVWLHARRYEERRGSARSWLLVMAHHKAVDAVRMQERHSSRWAREELMDEVIDVAPSPEEVAAATDTAVHLRRALDGLSAPLRETVSACFLQGRSQREVSRELGVPVGTVKTRSFRGVRELRARVVLSLTGE